MESTAISRTPTGTILLREMELLRRISVSHSTLWRMQREGRFPRSIRLSANAVAWREADVEQWIADRAAASR